MVTSSSDSTWGLVPNNFCNGVTELREVRVDKNIFAASGVTSCKRGNLTEIVTKLDMFILYSEVIIEGSRRVIQLPVKNILFFDWEST